MVTPHYSVSDHIVSHFMIICMANYPHPGMRTALSAAGQSEPRYLGFEEGALWLAEERTADLVHIELDDEFHSLDRDLIQRADANATRINVPLIISGPLSKVDLMADLACGPNSHWFCNPSLDERIAQTALILASNGTALNDVAGDVDTLRLRRLADEVSRIARALSSLTASERPFDGYAQAALNEARPAFRGEPMEISFAVPPPSADDIRAVLRQRRLRDRFFDPALFADPAWDMLLDLMAARLEDVHVAVSSLCIAAAVPPTTALRWIKTMTDFGLFERCADPDDGRRIFIQLSDSAMEAMARYFQASKKLGAAII